MTKKALSSEFGHFWVYLVVGPGRPGQDFFSWPLSDDFEQKLNSVAQKLRKLASRVGLGQFRVYLVVGPGRPGQDFFLWPLSDDFEQKMNSVAQKLTKLASRVVLGGFWLFSGRRRGLTGSTRARLFLVRSS